MAVMKKASMQQDGEIMINKLLRRKSRKQLLKENKELRIEIKKLEGIIYRDAVVPEQLTTDVLKEHFSGTLLGKW